MAWDLGECAPRKTDDAPCVHLTMADTSSIRTAILAYLDTVGDMPDIGLARRLAEPPIAQWTATSHQFASVIAPDHPGEAVELVASERVDTTTVAGFRCLLVRHDGTWTVVELAPYAESGG